MRRTHVLRELNLGGFQQRTTCLLERHRRARINLYHGDATKHEAPCVQLRN